MIEVQEKILFFHKMAQMIFFFNSFVAKKTSYQRGLKNRNYYQKSDSFDHSIGPAVSGKCFSLVLKTFGEYLKYIGSGIRVHYNRYIP